jgi:hypothetical protein
MKKPDTRHNLRKLWEMATGCGLQIPTDLPEWAAHLNDLHGAKEGTDYKYLIRYAKGVNGLTFPMRDDMVQGLDTVYLAVRAAVND